MRQVDSKPYKYKHESLKVKQFRLAARNLTNRVTGQEDLIKRYNSALSAMARASDASNSAEFKKKIDDTMRAVQGDGEWVNAGGVAVFQGKTFNPYRVFQKNRLRKKISQLEIAMQQLGISR